MKRVKKLQNKGFYRGCAFAHPLAYPNCSEEKRETHKSESLAKLSKWKF